MRHWRRTALPRLCLVLWLAVIACDILRATVDGFEDRTTGGLPGSVGAAAIAVTACTVIQAVSGAHGLRPRHRTLRVIAVTLWLMESAQLAMRNTGGRHPGDYLVGWIIVMGLAAATATVCLAVRATDDDDKARLIRVLADFARQDAHQFERHLCVAEDGAPVERDLRQADSPSLP